MCGRFSLQASGREIAERFELPEAPDLEPRFNIAPGTDVPIVRVRSTGERALELRRWGLVPRFSRDPASGVRMINARAETLAERPAFREAFRRRRCLLPADGFYEWQRRGRHKQPFYVRRADGDLFAFAGLYERWVGAGGEVVDSCALVTTEPNACMRNIHDRMPVILAPDGYARWLERGPGDPGALRALLRPCPSEWLEVRPVSTRVNDPKNEGAACIEPLVETQPSLL